MPPEQTHPPATEPGRARPPAQNTVGSTQQEPPGDADAPRNPLGTEARVSRAELNKVVGQRQAAKEKVRQLTAEVERLADLTREMPGDEELRAFREWKELRLGTDAPADENDGDTQAIARRARQPLTTRIEGLQQTKDALERRFMDLLRDQDLRVAAARANAINPDQVVALLRDRVRMVETDDGRFVPQFVGPDGQGAFDGPEPVRDTDRFVALFLATPENANLLRPTVTPGSGAKPAGGPAIPMDPTPRTKAEFLSLSPEERTRVAHQMTRQQRDTLLGRGPADDGGYF